MVLLAQVNGGGVCLAVRRVAADGLHVIPPASRDHQAGVGALPVSGKRRDLELVLVVGGAETVAQGGSEYSEGKAGNLYCQRLPWFMSSLQCWIGFPLT